MKKKLHFLSSLALGLLLVAGCQQNESVVPTADAVKAENGQVIPGQYLVMYKESAFANGRFSAPTYEGMLNVVRDYSRATLRMANVEFAEDDILQVFGVTHGFAIKNLDADEVEALRKNPNVDYVEQDQVWTLDDPIETTDIVSLGVSTQAQTLPWGITRVNGGVNYTGPRQAWIIDTGVDLTHPDLNVVTAKCKSFTGTATANDDNGHGSHVAGIIGAKNNTIGSVGVAAGAPVIGIKVLSSSGSGSTSQVVSGCNWVATYGAVNDVANLSLGGSVSTAMDNAVKAIAAKGVRVCVAAGNSAANANNTSPARANATNLYTVSAFGSGDVFASFSNYANPPIDYSEPGVSIYSCYKTGGYATLSGTSMATPHLAGILLLGSVRSGGLVTGDKDSTRDTIGIH
ncbi:MAG: S8 family serine peptidase [Spirosomataceae bacterium]